MTDFYEAEEFELVEDPSLHNFNVRVNKMIAKGWVFWDKPEIKIALWGKEFTTLTWRYVALMVKKGKRLMR